MMKKLNLVTLVILIFTLTLSGCRIKDRKDLKQDPNTWSKIMKNKKVVIGIDDSFVPMDFQTKSGKIVGYDVDLARAVFQQYGVTVEFQPIDWSMNTTELNNGTIDLIWNGFTINEQREKSMLFSKPYLKNGQVLVSKTDQKITNPQKMNNRVLGVQTGSAGSMDLDKHPKVLKKYIKDNNPIMYDTFTDAFIDLNANRIQGLLIDQVYANYYINKMQAKYIKYNVTPVNYPSEFYGVGMKKNDTKLKNKIDFGINKLAKNGELAKINRKWLGQKND
ncbi:amino acid ABC transporter substrate-binding protein [Lentilactobacillus laojiaonis]|uniref:amino acid ABC transporter substrate-binding protein n=1 Tax=Lentilactobacillus laojiaonis TaxID=2883998 RepID=UPI001D0B0875|nr:amino acid ABC transporter substrate-binding protein [Lentilactobacillus laojiaonis]UDM31724.1 amino acid ABC transporter substrate-binding protein [Lentilactobacillus laojiaonis]